MKSSIKGLWRFLKTPLGRRFLGLLLLLALLDDLHYRFVPSKEYKPVCRDLELPKDSRAQVFHHLQGDYAPAFIEAFASVLEERGISTLRLNGRLYTTRDAYRGTPIEDGYEGPRDDSAKRKWSATYLAVGRAMAPFAADLKIDSPNNAPPFQYRFCQGIRRVVFSEGDIARRISQIREKQNRGWYWTTHWPPDDQ